MNIRYKESLLDYNTSSIGLYMPSQPNKDDYISTHRWKCSIAGSSLKLCICDSVL